MGDMGNAYTILGEIIEGIMTFMKLGIHGVIQPAFRGKKKKCLKDKINELATNSKNKYIRDFIIE
jgi:hypothetical protein